MFAVIFQRKHLYARFAAAGSPVETAEVTRGAVMEVIEDTGVVTSRHVSVIVAKSNYEIQSVFRETGDAVEAGAQLMRTDTATGDSGVKSLEAQLSGLRTQEDQARQNARRLLILYESGAVSKSEYDAAAALEQELSAQAQSLEHSINEARENIQTDIVKAPVSGVVTELFVSAGDTAIMGAPLAEISDLSDLYIRAKLLADDAAKVSVGGRVILTDRPGDESLVGKISPKVTEEMSDLGIAQKRVDIEISANDPGSFILGGDVELQIVIDERTDTLTAPRKAVFSLDQKDFAYVVSDEGRAELRELTIGLKGKDSYEVLSGLSEGELVIVSPDGDIEDGHRVTPAAG
jgi:HlyD family secretion protein